LVKGLLLGTAAAAAAWIASGISEVAEVLVAGVPLLVSNFLSLIFDPERLLGRGTGPGVNVVWLRVVGSLAWGIIVAIVVFRLLVYRARESE
jgi:hypothetical protein